MSSKESRCRSPVGPAPHVVSICLALVSMVATQRLGAGVPGLPRGDANEDGRVSISDPVLVLRHLFQGDPASVPCEDSSDSNHDEAVDLSDAVFTLAFLFQGGPGPTPNETECGPASLSLVTDRMAILRAIYPDKTPAELEGILLQPLAIDRLAIRAEDGAVASSNDLLVLDAQSRTLFSVDLCPEPADERCGRTKLHYTPQGLAEEQGDVGVVRADMSLHLSSGWTLVFDSSTKNLLALRVEAPHTVLDEQGNPRSLLYRPAESPGSKNFGRGNGVLLSVVLTGEEAIEQLHVNGEPTISGLVEIERNKVLVVFATGTIRAIHLLELHEQDEVRDFDLDAEPANQLDEVTVKVLRGKFVSVPKETARPFLTFREIAELVTQDENLDLDSFQPIGIPGGGVLMFDRTTSTFMKVGIARDPQSGEILGGTAALGISPVSLRRILGELADPPFHFAAAFLHATTQEICLFERKTGSLLAFDSRKEPSESLRLLVRGEEMRGRSPRGPGEGLSLVFATADVLGSRLAFDYGLDEMLGVDYEHGAVHRILRRSQLTTVTGSSTVGICHLEPIGATEVRLFDQASASLLRLELR